MRIYCTGAMLVEAVGPPTSSDPRTHLIEPYKAPLVTRPKTTDIAVFRLPALTAAAMLWCDQPGIYKADIVWCNPEADDRPAFRQTTLRDATLSWTMKGDGPWLASYVGVQIEVCHKVSGVYHLRYLLDGEPIVDIPVPIFWEDDLAG